ncbi:MAG: hypothetical protein IPM98_16185 [Lewinellaceae bacterium]|nr:hypothetical protein [Lewinellaceae bacterium]
MHSCFTTRATGLLFLLLFGTQATLFGFQFADGTPPAPPTSPKYIFYWGNLQADLTAENRFHTRAQMTPQAFRQMLLRAPYLWNGAAMAQQVSFRLDGHPITATRGEQDYLSRLGWIDETFGARATTGQVLRLTDLYLDGQATGSIDLMLEMQEDSSSNDVVRWQNTVVSMLNTTLLEQVVWGREDIHEVSNRDFFTENEFWQTVQQIPFAVWNPYVTPTEIRAGIQIKSRTLTTQGFSCVLTPDTYTGMVANMANYKHLLEPGSVISLTLHTDQHERLFEKSLNIVANNDPRLALRRNRDTHTLKIKWGALEQSISNLYLLELRDTQGQLTSVDAPNNMRFTIQAGELEYMLTLHPQFWIDGEPLPDVTFHLSTPNRTTLVSPGQPMPDSLSADLAQTSGDLGMLRLHQMQTPGYDLSSLEFSVSFFTGNNALLVRNTLSALLFAPGSARIKLHPPAAQEKVFEVSFDLPEPANGRLSVFEPDGWVTYTSGDKFAAGRNSIQIPRSVFRRSGKHYLFLNTPFGVAKQEFDVR